MQRGASGIASIARLQYRIWNVSGARAAAGAIFYDTTGREDSWTANRRSICAPRHDCEVPGGVFGPVRVQFDPSARERLRDLVLDAERHAMDTTRIPGGCEPARRELRQREDTVREPASRNSSTMARKKRCL